MHSVIKDNKDEQQFNIMHRFGGDNLKIELVDRLRVKC